MQQVVDGITLTSIYLLFALGISLAWGTLRILNLAHGAIFMFSGFMASLLSKHWQLPLALWILVCGLMAGTISALLELLVFAPVRRRVPDIGQAETQMLIASTGVALALVTIAQNETQDLPFTLTSSYHTIIYHVRSVAVLNIQILIVAVAIGLTVLLSVWMKRSRNGRAIRALGIDAETSELMGINARIVSLVTMFVAGALAGVASILLLIYLGNLTPETGDDFLVKGFAVVVLGGVGSIKGTAIGALVLGAGETAVLVTTNGGYVDAVAFGVIIAVILLRPRGLFSQVRAERV